MNEIEVNRSVSRYVNHEYLEAEAWVMNTTEAKARCRIITQRIKDSALAYFKRIRKDERLWK